MKQVKTYCLSWMYLKLFLQGNYHYKVDLEDIAQKYYGGAFLYGSWSFKSIFYNDECNFSCAVTGVDFVPKKKTKWGESKMISCVKKAFYLQSKNKLLIINSFITNYTNRKDNLPDDPK